VRRLVALDLPAGQRFVDELRRAWDHGDAVLPVDQRLDYVAKRALVESMRVGVWVTTEGSNSLSDDPTMNEGDALVMATSGTTGKAKGVVLTHDALEASADSSNRALGTTADDHWLACLPLAHIGGLSVVIRALLSGSELTVHEGFDARAVERSARDGCNFVSLVPTALQRIDSSLFRTVLLGGSRPPTSRPPNVIATYGLTETGSGVVYDGRPLPGVEVKCSDAGEVFVRGRMLMRCYRDGSTSIDSDGWLHTGDSGTYTDGILNITGRLDDLIKSGGEKVWPDQVERAIQVLIGDHQYCVVGVDDPEWGQKVVLVTTNSEITLDRVRSTVKESLPAFFAPKDLVVLDALPATALGKIRRAECASLAARVLSSRS